MEGDYITVTDSSGNRVYLQQKDETGPKVKLFTRLRAATKMVACVTIFFLRVCQVKIEPGHIHASA